MQRFRRSGTFLLPNVARGNMCPMSTTTTHISVPETPLLVLRRDSLAPQGAFFVSARDLEFEPEVRDITDGQIEALAQLILDYYHSWNEQ